MPDLSSVVQIVGIACAVIMIINLVRWFLRTYNEGILESWLKLSNKDADVIVSLLGAATLGGYYAVTNTMVGSYFRR
jgi:hypothetical protein